MHHSSYSTERTASVQVLLISNVSYSNCYQQIELTQVTLRIFMTAVGLKINSRCNIFPEAAKYNITLDMVVRVLSLVLTGAYIGLPPAI